MKEAGQTTRAGVAAHPAHAPHTTGWLSRHTSLGETASALFDEPAAGFGAWARTTAGTVALLFALQLTTGVLLAFYFVPSTESAHTTVVFIEKVVPSGSWIRALHSHGSHWLVVALVLHLAQRLFVGEGWRRRPVGWVASVVLLALALAGGATGYSLPWDARAFYSTRIAASIAGGLPLAGDAARAWLVGGAELSTLTLSRFFALHAFVVPALILATLIARLFVFRERAGTSFAEREAAPNAEREATTESAREAATDAAVSPSRRAWRRAQLARQASVAGLVFFALAVYSWKMPAPLAPPAESVAPGYLPRPGAQFLWLFQMLKYMPAPVASLSALLLPLLLLGSLALLPFLDTPRLSRLMAHPRRNAGVAIFTLGLALVATLTTLAYLEDARDPRLREQLAAQAREEAAFRAKPFEPRRVRTGDTNGDTSQVADSNSSSNSSPSGSASHAAAATTPPEAYAKNCARCHGAHGEGRFANPRLIGINSQPRRTLEDIVAIINDPPAYGLEKRMPSFARKLSEEEKLSVAAWVVSLKP